MSENVCNCLAEMNAKLKEKNAAIACGFSMSPDLHEMRVHILVGVVKVDKRKRTKLPNVVASYCPFCGKRGNKDSDHAGERT